MAVLDPGRGRQLARWHRWHRPGSRHAPSGSPPAGGREEGRTRGRLLQGLRTRRQASGSRSAHRVRRRFPASSRNHSPSARGDRSRGRSGAGVAQAARRELPGTLGSPAPLLLALWWFRGPGDPVLPAPFLRPGDRPHDRPQGHSGGREIPDLGFPRVRYQGLRLQDRDAVQAGRAGSRRRRDPPQVPVKAGRRIQDDRADAHGHPGDGVCASDGRRKPPSASSSSP